MLPFPASSMRTFLVSLALGVIAAGANAQSQFQPELTKRWFRITITLTGGNPVCTLWCIGFLMVRES